MSSRSSATRARSTSTTTSSASSVATGHCPACRRATSSIDEGSRQPRCPIDRRGSDEPICEGCLGQQRRGRGRGCDRCDRHWVAQWRRSKTAHANALALFNRHAAEAQVDLLDGTTASCCSASPPRSRSCPTTGGASLAPSLPRHSPGDTRCCLTSASASSPRRRTASSRVASRSRTDTFVAAKLWVDNPRWRGVAFLLRPASAWRRVSDESACCCATRPTR